MNNRPLKYGITSWDQLSRCRSNNSRDLRITVSHIINDRRLNGTLISVVHKDFGTLFATLVDSDGPLMSGTKLEMTTSSILQQLENFGFLIEYSPEEHLDGDQLNFLIVLQNFNFDKIRLLNVYTYNANSTKTIETKLVAFKIRYCSNWLSNTYECSDIEYTKALKEGWCIDVNKVANNPKYRWDWLTYPADIADILAEQCTE